MSDTRRLNPLSFHYRKGETGTGACQFSAPTCPVYCAENSLLYILDTGNHRVQSFDVNAVDVAYGWGSAGTGVGQFTSPDSMIIRPNRVLVLDHPSSGVGRIQAFDLDGAYQWSIEIAQGLLAQHVSSYAPLGDPSASGYITVKHLVDVETKIHYYSIDDGSYCGYMTIPYGSGTYELEGINWWCVSPDNSVFAAEVYHTPSGYATPSHKLVQYSPIAFGIPLAAREFFGTLPAAALSAEGMLFVIMEGPPYWGGIECHRFYGGYNGYYQTVTTTSSDDARGRSIVFDDVLRRIVASIRTAAATYSEIFSEIYIDTMLNHEADPYNLSLLRRDFAPADLVLPVSDESFGSISTINDVGEIVICSSVRDEFQVWGEMTRQVTWQ